MNTSPSISSVRRVIALVAIAAIALGLGACSQDAEDLSDEELRSELIEVLSDGDTITDEQASCVVDGLFDQAPRDQINRMANADTADEITAEDQELLFDVLIGCI